MTNNQLIAAGVLGLLIPPLILLLTGKKSFNRGGKGLVVTCPKCAADLKLSRLRNYKCPKCNEDVQFFDLKTGKLRSDTVFIKCADCGQENPSGLKFCVKCEAPL